MASSPIGADHEQNYPQQIIHVAWLQLSRVSRQCAESRGMCPSLRGLVLLSRQPNNPAFGPAVDRSVCCFQMSFLCLTWQHFKPCRPSCLSTLYFSLCRHPKRRKVALKSVNPANMLQLTVCAHLLHLAMKNIRRTAWKRLTITSQKLHVLSCYGVQPF